jgi:hypothetical protein
MFYSTRVVLQIEDEIGQYTVLEKDSHEYCGEVAKCCGPNNAETTAQSNEANLASTMSADFNSRFGNQSALISQLQNSLSPIVAQGPSQNGMSASELASLNSGAITSSAAAARNARQAAGNFSAGQGGGGTSGLQSGVTKQINASVDSSAANNLATQQNQINLANEQQGRANFFQAQGGLEALGGMENPEAFGGLANNSNASSFNEASQIEQQQAQKDSEIAGAVTSGLGLAGKFAAGAAGGGGLAGGLANLGG